MRQNGIEREWEEQRVGEGEESERDKENKDTT